MSKTANDQWFGFWKMEEYMKCCVKLYPLSCAVSVIELSVGSLVTEAQDLIGSFVQLIELKGVELPLLKV